MRDELHAMELVDRYVDGEMGDAESKAFEQRMGASAELEQLVNEQRALREGLQRLHLRSAVQAAHRGWMLKRWAPWAATGLVVISIMGYLFLGMDHEHDEMIERPLETSPFAHEPVNGEATVAEPLPAPAVDTVDLVTNEALKVESVFLPSKPEQHFRQVREVPGILEESTEPIADTCKTMIDHGISSEPALAATQIEMQGTGYEMRAARVDSIRLSRKIGSPSSKPLMAIIEEPAKAETQPSYPGGWEAMHVFLRKHLRVPEGQDRIGTVVIGFVVDKKGDVQDAEVTQSLSPEYDKEALRVIRMMPRWRPCFVGDKPLKSRVDVPIRFGEVH
jgi:periplasmic protein TonB